jgi:hypothetical protein
VDRSIASEIDPPRISHHLKSALGWKARDVGYQALAMLLLEGTI